MLAGFHMAKAFIAILRGTKKEATPSLSTSSNNLRCLAFQQPIYQFCSTLLWVRALQIFCSGGRDEREIECSQNIRFLKGYAAKHEQNETYLQFPSLHSAKLFLAKLLASQICIQSSKN